MIHKHISIFIYTHFEQFPVSISILIYKLGLFSIIYLNNGLNISVYAYSKAFRHSHTLPIMFLLQHSFSKTLWDTMVSFIFQDIVRYNGLIHFSKHCEIQWPHSFSKTLWDIMVSFIFQDIVWYNGLNHFSNVLSHLMV